jgi:hypothetical protein
LPRKIRALRPCDDFAYFTLQPQSQGHDRNVSASYRIPYQRRPFPRIGPRPVLEYLADLVRLGRLFLRLSEPKHLDGRLTVRVPQPYIDEIKLEHSQKRVEQGMNNLGWLTAAPNGRKGEQAYQVIYATLKSLDILCNISGLCIHISGRRM